MKYIKIANTDLEVAPINLGGNVFGWTLDEKQSFGILDAFADAGFNFIDTANIYSCHLDLGAFFQTADSLKSCFDLRGGRKEFVLTSEQENKNYK